MILLNPGYYDMIYVYIYIYLFIYISLVSVIFCKFILHKPVNAFFEALHRGLRPAPVGLLLVFVESFVGLGEWLSGGWV